MKTCKLDNSTVAADAPYSRHPTATRATHSAEPTADLPNEALGVLYKLTKRVIYQGKTYEDRNPGNTIGACNDCAHNGGYTNFCSHYCKAHQGPWKFIESSDPLEPGTDR